MLNEFLNNNATLFMTADDLWALPELQRLTNAKWYSGAEFNSEYTIDLIKKRCPKIYIECSLEDGEYCIGFSRKNVSYHQQITIEDLLNVKQHNINTEDILTLFDGRQ